MNMNSPFEAQGTAQANNPYVHYSPVPATSNSSTKRPMANMVEALSQCGKRVEVATRRAEAMVDNVWNHLRMCPSFTEAAKARLNTGTKVHTTGGQEKVFQQTFERITGEKLLHSYACYLSTSHGSVIGMLCISNVRIAFCSDFSHYLSPGHPTSMHYKVVVQLDQLRT
ncbi:GLABRA2 expression modulator-like [Pyrus ussuriensis x Pyrus communis]|uniref:GLABRA2 expression modulator-like n=1 Tax=Pyrus ussuriensis x Pyrus communis TaxID=2448454 RepID=A0A5N5FLW7_9ROSA|nr:GLABRA2 expression modulator-like [Pyrus ussuriensis x Pyrus communis]